MAAIPWRDGFEAALREAARARTLALVSFVSAGRPASRTMDEQTFARPDVVRVAASFIPVRVDADACKYILVFFGDRDRFAEIIRMRVTGSDVEHCGDARFPRPPHNLIAVPVKRLAVDMAVGINEGHRSSKVRLFSISSNAVRLSCVVNVRPMLMA